MASDPPGQRPEMSADGWLWQAGETRPARLVHGRRAAAVQCDGRWVRCARVAPGLWRSADGRIWTERR